MQNEICIFHALGDRFGKAKVRKTLSSRLDALGIMYDYICTRCM